MTRASIDDVDLVLRQRPASLLFEASLGGVAVDDLWCATSSCVPNSVPTVVPRVDASDRRPSRPVVRRAGLRGDAATLAAANVATSTAPLVPAPIAPKPPPPLLFLHVEQAPLDGAADVVVAMRMLSLDIVATRPFLDRLGEFASPPRPVDLSVARSSVRLGKTRPLSIADDAGSSGVGQHGCGASRDARTTGAGEIFLLLFSFSSSFCCRLRRNDRASLCCSTLTRRRSLFLFVACCRFAVLGATHRKNRRTR